MIKHHEKQTFGMLFSNWKLLELLRDLSLWGIRGESKSEKKHTPGWAKVSQLGVKVQGKRARRESVRAHRSQVEPKGCQEWAKGWPKLWKNQFSEKVVKREPKLCANLMKCGFLLEQFSINNRIKTRCKNRYHENMKFHEESMPKWCRNWQDIFPKTERLRLGGFAEMIVLL